MAKRTADNKWVPDRMWYYLLDWNEEDEHKTLYEKFKVVQLLRLSYSQFLELFRIATEGEYLKLKQGTLFDPPRTR